MVQLFEEVTDQQKLSILANFGKTLESSKNEVIVLKEWCLRQPHLPDIPCDSMLESFLKLSKYNFEKAKTKIDNFYTIRIKLPEILQVDINPNNLALKKYAEYSYLIKLPKLLDDLSRVTLHKLATKDPNHFNPVWSFIWHLNLATIGMMEDFNSGYTLIYDLENYTLGHVTKITPLMIRKAVQVYKKSLTTSVKSIHFVNCPAVVDQIVKIVKATLNPKIVNRIHVHHSLTSLYDHVPRKNLPKDYGGEEKSIKELNEIVKEKMIEYKDYFDHLDTLTIDDNLRPENLIDDEFLGIYGNFKKLDID